MKKLIPVQGKGGRAVVEITEKGARVKPSHAGELWLYGGALVKGEECTALHAVTGAVLVQDGAALMWGGIGTGEGARRILAEAVMRSGRGAQQQAAAPEEKAQQQSKTPAPEEKAQQQAAAPEEMTHPQEKTQQQPLHNNPAKPHNDKGDNNGNSGLSRPPNPGAALLEILKKAEELFPQTGQPQTERRQDSAILNPFPDAFPFSRWHRREYPGTNRHYLEGEWLKGGVTYMIYALPGEQRGSRHRGFPRFLRSRDGSGYWVKVTRK